MSEQQFFEYAKCHAKEIDEHVQELIDLGLIKAKQNETI